MEISFQQRGFLERFLAKTGGSYVIFAIIFAQIAASVGTLLGFISEQLNANYAPKTSALLGRIEAIAIPAVIILLVAIVTVLSRNMRTSLDNWKQDPELFKTLSGNMLLQRRLYRLS